MSADKKRVTVNSLTYLTDGLDAALATWLSSHSLFKPKVLFLRCVPEQEQKHHLWIFTGGHNINSSASTTGVCYTRTVVEHVKPIWFQTWNNKDKTTSCCEEDTRLLIITAHIVTARNRQAINTFLLIDSFMAFMFHCCFSLLCWLLFRWFC